MSAFVTDITGSFEEQFDIAYCRNVDCSLYGWDMRGLHNPCSALFRNYNDLHCETSAVYVSKCFNVKPLRLQLKLQHNFAECPEHTLGTYAVFCYD